jgi:hypothetical protein
MRRSIHYLLWAFVIALLFDGALRKWFLPGFSDILLLSRVPITLLIYILALQIQLFPRNQFIGATIFLAVVTSATGYFAHGSILALGYGALTNYFFIPLIFIFPKIWDWSDVQRVGKFFMLLAIPMTVLLGLQFYLPQSAWVNLSVGGTEGAGFTGALGRYRPPATFSFITGTAQFYTLFSAFFLYQFMHRKTLPMPLLVTCGICLPLAVFGSISRLLALSVVVVFAMALFALIYSGRRMPSSFRIFAVIAFSIVIVSQLTFFDDATDAFAARWESSTGEESGGVQEAIVMRVVGGLTDPFIYMGSLPLTGYGLGAGTQAGAQLISGERGFAYAEGEWGRVMAELGPLFGTLFIALRVALTAYLGKLALRQVQRGNFLPWLVFAASIMLIMTGQWGQQTSLGFAILGAGLTLSACRTGKHSPRDIKAAAINRPTDGVAITSAAANGSSRS